MDDSATTPGPGGRRAARSTAGRADPTIEDVARIAGVSVATVSRALRGLPNVAPATRARVVEVATRLEYRADPHAARLAAGRTSTVGIAVPYLHRWYFAQVIGGVEGVLAPAGFDLLLYVIAGEEARRGFLGAGRPFRKRVDGLIAVDLAIHGAEAAALAESGIRLVSIGRPADPFPSVRIDNRAAVRSAVEHLIDLGHRRIASIGGPDDHPLGFSTPGERSAAYREVLLDHGIPPDPALEVDGGFTVAGGTQAMRALLALDAPPTAVFAASDEMAMGALVALRAAGLAVPGAVSVVGFDDHDAADALGLTTVHQGALAQGATAASMLLDALTGVGPREPTGWWSPTELVVRRSTGPPPGGGA